MTILNTFGLNCNNKIKANFNGGNLSSDAGLILLKEFMGKLGIESLLSRCFKTNDHAAFRIHTDVENLLQLIYQIIAGYFEDDCADELTNDPMFKTVLNKVSLASQPTLSRFHNRLDMDTLAILQFIQAELRRRVYSVELPEHVILDLDSTLLNTYGRQAGSKYNHHYDSVGYHPLVCYDSFTGDLLGIKLRDGSDYCSNGAAQFLYPILKEFRTRYESVNLFVRGDSGFSAPELYTVCEDMKAKYVIRLKENSILHEHAHDLNDKLQRMVDIAPDKYQVVFGEFFYQAKSWTVPRRVICKVEKHPDKLFFNHTFIVTNMEADPSDLVKLYCKRGLMENYIKEGKSGFDFAAVSSPSRMVNANNLQIHALAYNIFNYFRRMALPKKMQKLRIDAIRLKLIKIAVKIVSTSRYQFLKMCSSCPYKREFYGIIQNINALRVKLE